MCLFMQAILSLPFTSRDRYAGKVAFSKDTLLDFRREDQRSGEKLKSSSTSKLAIVASAFATRASAIFATAYVSTSRTAQFCPFLEFLF